jgi:dTDP-4-dehydrorhamnose 3,5-epimerase
VSDRPAPRDHSPTRNRLPPGVELLELSRHADDRGSFLKVFDADGLAKTGRDAGAAEVFLSSSNRGVVRGLHFQLPPHDHAKTVVCIAGRAFDVALDLRRGSPTEGQVATFLLDGRSPSRLHLPSGLAHGFQALDDETVLAYVTSTGYAPAHDHGVRFDSVGVSWPLPLAAISERDLALPRYDTFRSPFVWADLGSDG